MLVSIKQQMVATITRQTAAVVNARLVMVIIRTFLTAESSTAAPMELRKQWIVQGSLSLTLVTGGVTGQPQRTALQQP